MVASLLIFRSSSCCVVISPLVTYALIGSSPLLSVSAILEAPLLPTTLNAGACGVADAPPLGADDVLPPPVVSTLRIFLILASPAATANAAANGPITKPAGPPTADPAA